MLPSSSPEGCFCAGVFYNPGKLGAEEKEQKKNRAGTGACPCGLIVFRLPKGRGLLSDADVHHVFIGTHGVAARLFGGIQRDVGFFH